jgi:hypothetical protein
MDANPAAALGASSAAVSWVQLYLYNSSKKAA